jgi:hypothetical protein
VRALGELQDAASSMLLDNEPASEVQRKLADPRAASWEVAKGEAQIAIGLPPAGHRELVREDGKLPATDATTRLAWIQLPGADKVYHASTNSWDKSSPPNRVAVLGVGDRLAAVTSSSHNAATAFKLLGWLARPDVASQLASAGERTMPVRNSQAAAADWYDGSVNASERADLARALRMTLSRDDYLILPRIPGIDEYMLTLDEAVEDVVFEKAAPMAALQKAAAHWELTTERLGREKQRQAYLKHLGISE